MYPKLFEYGEFFLPTYGVLVALGFLAALWVVNRLSREAGLDPERSMNLALYCVLSGLVGAKLLYIVLEYQRYLARPGDLFTISTLQSGGAFYGGLILAIVVSYLYGRRQKLPWLRTADVFAPAIAIGHGIGRLGCFAAGCCWGGRCDLPWAVVYTDPEANRLVGVPLNIHLHPTQLYEAGGEFLIFGFLWWRFHRKHREGTIIGLYLILYSILRFSVEFVRHHEQENLLGLPLSNAQWISLVLIAVGAAILARKSAPPARVPQRSGARSA
jgi:phosphatidylglycerol---prolipoprotein diacylglyceryl transferase